jgi:hypothetical protein
MNGAGAHTGSAHHSLGLSVRVLSALRPPAAAEAKVEGAIFGRVLDERKVDEAGGALSQVSSANEGEPGVIGYSYSGTRKRRCRGDEVERRWTERRFCRRQHVPGGSSLPKNDRSHVTLGAPALHPRSKSMAQRSQAIVNNQPYSSQY